MRIAIISDWFAEQMGYAENCLPKAMAALGHEVHLITSNVQPYYNSPNYQAIYEPFIGPAIQPCVVKPLDGYTLHRLPHATVAGKLRISGLVRSLRILRPQIVQTFDTLPAPSTLEVAIARRFVGYRLFLESHAHASVFPLATGDAPWQVAAYWGFQAATFGRVINAAAEVCYAISTDAADIAVRFFGIDARKMRVCSLGVDTDLFRPAVDEAEREARTALRAQLGFAPSDIVCIYTGRFSEDKNPLCLAQAIELLTRQGKPYRALFVGSGTNEQISALSARTGCVVHPFVPVHLLPDYYRAADVGVWPKQESTSQLDAAACGLPLIISNRVAAVERVAGNGLTYEENDPVDLSHTLDRLGDPKIRRDLGARGADKILRNFSWRAIARARIDDYEAALSSKSQRFHRRNERAM